MDSLDIIGKYREPKLLFLNQHNGTFKDVSKLVGPAIQIPQVSRGVAVGDLFNDGRLDIVIENLKGGPMILQPQGGPANHWISFELEGTKSNRLALNARVKAASGDLHHGWWRTAARRCVQRRKLWFQLRSSHSFRTRRSEPSR